jgi:exonuclease VII large subunit
MKIDLQLELQLESIWRSIGLSSSEIEAHYEDLKQRVTDVVAAFLREHSTVHASLTQEAQAAEDAVHVHMQRFRIDEPDDLDNSASLRLRIQKAKSRLDQLTEQTREQEEEFRSTFAGLVECFEVLEIEDRGEYAEEGSDFGYEKLDRMTELITTLKTDIANRVPRMKELCAEVDRIRKLLGLPEGQKPNTVGDVTFERLTAERNEYEQKLEINASMEDASPRFRELETESFGFTAHFCPRLITISTNRHREDKAMAIPAPFQPSRPCRAHRKLGTRDGN